MHLFFTEPNLCQRIMTYYEKLQMFQIVILRWVIICKNLIMTLFCLFILFSVILKK